MSFANWMMLLATLLAAALSYRNPRGLLWIGAAVIDYVVSVTYWRTGLPYGELVAGMADAAVCLTIYFRYQERWEKLIYRVFQVSLTVNIFFLLGNLGIFYAVSIDVYSEILEALNALTLLLIGGTGAAQWAGAIGGAAHRPASRLGRALRALRAPREAPPFSEVP